MGCCRAGDSAAADSIEPAQEPAPEVPDIRAPLADEATAAPVVTPSADEEHGKTDLLLTQEFPQPRKDTVRAIRVEKESIMYEPEDDAPRVSLLRVTIFAAIAVAAAYVATQDDLVDRIGQAIESRDVSLVTDAFEPDPEIIDAPVIDESLQDIAEYVPGEMAESETAGETSEQVVETPVSEAGVAGVTTLKI